ncbi:addiction module protein [Nannocystaceae bacterium ST9]
MIGGSRKILDEAMSSSEPDRRTLAEALMDTVTKPDESIEPEWRNEILRRIEQVRNGEVTTEPWSEVRRQLRDART